MEQTAIVFGATGLTGSSLLLELLEDSRFSKIKVFARYPLPISDARIEQVILADFDKLEEFSSSIKGDVVFCCLGTTIRQAGTAEAFRKIDLTYPVTISKIAQANNIPSFVVISSIGADYKSKVLYLRTKGEMEKTIRLQYSGNLKVLRPSMLLGHRKEFRLAEEIGKVLTIAIGFILLGPLRKYRGVKASVVAKAMIKSLDLPADKLIIESNEIVKLGESETKIPNYAVK
jgi:uncharacterized protein YbjT (DUF2867 family)